MPHDIFVSYSTKDKPTADAVCATLESKGIRCWIAPRDILPGVDWGEALIEAIEGSKIMVLVFSQNANDSPQIKREVERAVHKGVAVVPVRIEDVPMSKSLEFFVSTPHWLDALTPPLERHLNQLAETLKVLLARVGQKKGLVDVEEPAVISPARPPETARPPESRPPESTRPPDTNRRPPAPEIPRRPEGKPPPIGASGPTPPPRESGAGVRPPPMPPVGPPKMPAKTFQQWVTDPANRPLVIIGAIVLLFLVMCFFFSVIASLSR